MTAASGDDIQGLKNEPVLSCFLGKAYCVSEGRNAWHSTWVASGKVFQTSKDAFGLYTLSKRQGSSLAVIELPAIEFVGRECAVMVADSVRDIGVIMGGESPPPIEPFKACARVAIEDMTLLGIVKWSGLNLGPNLYTFERLVCSTASAVPAHLPFVVSYEEGGVWVDRPRKINLNAVCELIKRVTLRLQGA